MAMSSSCLNSEKTASLKFVRTLQPLESSGGGWLGRAGGILGRRFLVLLKRRRKCSTANGY